MKYLAVVLVTFISLQAFSQSIPPTERKHFEDSVFKYYMNDRAWKCGLFSRERERYIDSALAILPHNAYLWQQRGMPLLKQNKYELAMSYFDSAVKYDAKRWLDYRATMKCTFVKNYSAALIDFNLARALNGNIVVMDHPYDFYSALCHLQLNQFDSAKFYLRKCIDHTMANHGESWVHYVHWFYLGIVRHEMEDYAGALEYLNKSMVDYPRFSDAGYYKARCQVKLKQYQEALATIRQANQDAAEGYTLNEDQALYEIYPYQIKKYQWKNIVAWVEEAAKN